MRIVVEKNRIEGFCEIKGWRGEQSVIAFSTIMGEWHTASSMCLPSDIDSAIMVSDCVSKVIEELKKVTHSNDLVQPRLD